MFRFQVGANSSECAARTGTIDTDHGRIETPVFMPVGTLGTVKGLTPQQLLDINVQILLGNTYHLMLRPGAERMAQFGGLHRFMNWNGPILTDSGGFQVFSLADLSKKTEDGVRFRSHIDGSTHFLSPERSMEIQAAIGSDIVMAFDDCAPHPADRKTVEAAMARTHKWADRCLDAFKGGGQALFGIVQGGVYEDLRSESAREIDRRPFAGNAIGGLSVGEPKPDMYRILRHTTPLLSPQKPRYLMGVGTPADLINAVWVGVDMFDCVMPTRNARNGQAFTSQGTVTIKQAQYREDLTPLDSACGCYTCTHFSKAYLHHLYRAGEMLSGVLMSLHNIYFYQDLMAQIRKAIDSGGLADLKARVLTAYDTVDIQSDTLETASC